MTVRATLSILGTILKTNSEQIRIRMNIFIEPYLKDLCSKNKLGLSMSKYIRYAVINQLIRDDVQLSVKYAPFVHLLKSKTCMCV